MNKPDFFIIGAAKAGTTSLHARLQMHPDLFMTIPKEPEFFARDEYYCKGFASYENLFRDRLPGQICGEASTLYSLVQLFGQTPSRIRAYQPDAKIIFLLREPVSRAFSYYSQLVKNYQRSTKQLTVSRSFEECLFGNRNNIAHRDLFFAPFDNHLPDIPELFLAGSEYLPQIDAYLEHFPRENLLFLTFEDFIRDQDRTCKEVLEFIGGDPERLLETDSVAVNTAAGHHIDVETQLKMTQLKKILGPVYTLKSLLPDCARKTLRSLAVKHVSLRNETTYAPQKMKPETRNYLADRYYSDFARLQQVTGLNLFSAWHENLPPKIRERVESHA